MACGLMLLFGGGMLTWYYTHAIARQSRTRAVAQAAASRKAQGEMPLPPLDVFNALKTSNVSAQPNVSSQPPGNAPVPDTGGIQSPDRELAPLGADSSGALPLAPAAYGRIPRSSIQRGPLDRQLTGAAFAREQAGRPGPGAADRLLAAPDPVSPGGPPGTEGVTQRNELESLLRPAAIASVSARVLPTRRFLLSKGAFVDCTLETAIDSTLPGMTTCITATDTFSSDGTVVLLERGTKLIGETRGQIQQGAARVFVLWTEARTPAGIVVPLDAPGTDELGRSGLPGEINRHFWDRFGAAILVSTLDGAVQAAVESSARGSGPIVYNPSGSETVVTDVLKSTVNIPPTIRKRNGDRIQVFVARDVDFRTVYELRTASSAR